MRQDLWREILGARDDIDKAVAKAVGDYPSQPPPRAATATATAMRPPPRVATARGAQARAASPSLRAVAPQETPRMWREPARLTTATGTVTAVAAAPVASLEQEALQRLHQDVLARITDLRKALAAEPGVEQAMLALVFYFDERIMSQLSPHLATSWPYLQERFTRRNTGGSDFFLLIDRLLQGESAPAFVLEVCYFCLASGFEGQYADDLESLEGYQQRLRGRIPVAEPARPPREPAAKASPSPIWSPALYYVIAGLAVIAVAILLTRWSNG